LADSLVALSEQIASTVEQVSKAIVSVHARHRFDSRGQDVTAVQVVSAVCAAAAALHVLPVEDGVAFHPRSQIHEPVDDNVEPLTAREMDVLEMLAEGLSNKLIAHRLSISEHTAKFHVNSILAKLSAGTRTEAVTRGIRLGLIKV
jgi:DNA-binding NarL/FixJ family response regulator